MAGAEPLAARRLSSHLLVGGQLLGLALACYPVGLSNSGAWGWLLLCLCGALLGLTTLCYNTVGNFSVYPEVKTNARLITAGPYGYVRHPMYSALIVMTLGVALYNGHWLNGLGFILLLGAVSGKALREERLLDERFTDYRDYRARTWRFIPYLY